MDRLKRLWSNKESNWGLEVMAHPYLFLATIYESWYEMLDQSAWGVGDMATAVEEVRLCGVSVHCKHDELMITHETGHFRPIETTI
jgi:hypothetical protein